jgi:hypothetical protein
VQRPRFTTVIGIVFPSFLGPNHRQGTTKLMS